MIRTYPLKHSITQKKQAIIRSIIKEYQKLACCMAGRQWREFFENGDFDKDLDIKNIESKLSERYKQTCQYQVVGILNSFISNRQNDFVKIVFSANLSEDIKHKLFVINKKKLWFSSKAEMAKVDEKGKTVKGEFVEIDLELIKLARCIFKRILQQHRKPNLSRCNLALDNKVARVETKQHDDKKKAIEFDYWIILSTLEKRKQIALPLKSNEFFEKQPGEIRKFCQINLKQDQLQVCLVKNVEKASNYEIKNSTISLDLGLRTLLATNYGDLFSRDFIERLKKYDHKITQLARNRQRQGLKVKSAKYQKYVSQLRSLLKNEICRVVNRIIKVHCPKKIIIENLNFRNPKLSRRINRLLSNFGKRFMTEKLESVKEKFSLIIEKVNPAYTSQTCCHCGYVDPKNRTGQSLFTCRHCGKKLHADVNAARNILHRSRDKQLKDIYLKKSVILEKLVARFIERYPKAPEKLLAENPYFKAHMAKCHSLSKAKMKLVS